HRNRTRSGGVWTLFTVGDVHAKKFPARRVRPCERGCVRVKNKAQKINFAPSWKVLGSKVEVTCPKVLDVLLESTFLNCVWFQTLKASARNWNILPRDSLNTKFLKNERFQLSRPGPRRASKPRLPQVPAAGAVNALVVNHWVAFCG